MAETGRQGAQVAMSVGVTQQRGEVVLRKEQRGCPLLQQRGHHCRVERRVPLHPAHHVPHSPGRSTATARRHPVVADVRRPSEFQRHEGYQPPGLRRGEVQGGRTEGTRVSRRSTASAMAPAVVGRTGRSLCLSNGMKERHDVHH